MICCPILLLAATPSTPVALEAGAEDAGADDDEVGGELLAEEALDEVLVEELPQAARALAVPMRMIEALCHVLTPYLRFVLFGELRARAPGGLSRANFVSSAGGHTGAEAGGRLG